MSKEIFKKVVANDPKALAEIKLAVLNGLDIKYEMNEATNYEIKDNKVLITRDNYNKKHKDYKLGKKGEEKLLVLDPKSGGTVLMPVKFIDEAIDEAKAKTPYFGLNDTGKMNYAVQINNIDNDYPSMPFGRQIEYRTKIKDFKDTAKKTRVDAKGKGTMPSVKAWVKDNKPSEFWASWPKDSSSYKDDSVEIFYK